MGEYWVNTDNIVIEEKDIAYAYNECKHISDSETKNRAVENIVAANVANKLLKDSPFSVDVESGLHNLATVVEELNISDIYINGAFVNVCAYFENSSPAVPAIHFKENILPSAYMFIKISSDLSHASLSGFTLPENIKQTNDEYFIVDESQLLSINDVESRFREAGPETITELEIFKFIEGSEANRFDFYKKLLTSKDARLTFIKAVKAQSVFNHIAYSPELQNELDDQTIIDNFDNDSEVVFEELMSSEPTADTEGVSYEYNTVATPELNMEPEQNSTDDYSTDSDDNSSEQIDALFNSEQENANTVPAKKKTSPVMYILIVALLGALGLWGHSFYSQNSSSVTGEKSTENVAADETPKTDETKPAAQESSAMPVEDVNTPQTKDIKEEPSSAGIPAIEQNLDASILVSNLKVDWQVPAGYASNTAAKRYLIKLGKIIQLNLKTELLLLTKPPISNKVLVEIKFNDSSKKFEPVGITASSGEKSVDDVIMQTLQKALNMNISVNKDSFDKLQGNPVLIIKL